jgi:hypothetical protein
VSQVVKVQVRDFGAIAGAHRRLEALAALAHLVAEHAELLGRFIGCKDSMFDTGEPWKAAMTT